MIIPRKGTATIFRIDRRYIESQTETLIAEITLNLQYEPPPLLRHHIFENFILLNLNVSQAAYKSISDKGAGFVFKGLHSTSRIERLYSSLPKGVTLAFDLSLNLEGGSLCINSETNFIPLQFSHENFIKEIISGNIFLTVQPLYYVPGYFSLYADAPLCLHSNVFSKLFTPHIYTVFLSVFPVGECRSMRQLIGDILVILSSETESISVFDFVTELLFTLSSSLPVKHSLIPRGGIFITDVTRIYKYLIEIQR